MTKMLYKLDGGRYEIENPENIYEKSGRAYIDKHITCDRCNGTGLFGWGAVVNGNTTYAGTCFKCGGAGYIFKTFRAYTEEEIERENAAAERKAERERQQAERDSDTNLRKWCIKNGFDPETKTTTCILGNTFPIKDDLKGAGAKFNQIFKWHLPELPTEDEDFVLPSDCYTLVVKFDDAYTWDCQSKGVIVKEGADQIVANYEKAQRKPDTSEYVGELKERLRDMGATYEGGHSFMGAFGESYVHNFRVDGNLFTWFTSKDLNLEKGDFVNLTGTVKDHQENKYGVKATILTRCIVR